MDLITQAAGLPSTELQAMSTEQLRGELARSLQLNAAQLLHLAAVWRELERRGEDLTDLRSGMGAYLPMIAGGRLAADAVVKFAGQPTLLRAMFDLPLDLQQELVNGKPLPVLGLDTAGNPRVTELPAYSLTAAQVRQVFGPARIRDQREQEAVLVQTVTRKKAARAAAPQARVRFDAQSDQLVIGRTRLPVASVFEALAADADEDVTGDDDKLINIKLTDEQHKRLRVRAAESGSTMAGLIKLALRRAGLI